MRNTSVVVGRPNPTTIGVVGAISPEAADWPIARPSAKLSSPILTAISSASRRGGPASEAGTR